LVAVIELPAPAKRVAVVGADGFVGRWMFATVRAHHPDALGTGRRPGEGLAHLDLTDHVDLPWAGHSDGLILAGQTNVGACERDPRGTRLVNVEGTLRVAESMLAEGVRPVFFSSDYVFSGREGGYRPNSPREPTTEYGRQKVAVEDGLRALSDRALIVRLGKTFSVERGSGTLLDETAAQLARGEMVRAATDQVLTPTRVEDVVCAVLALLGLGNGGTFHVCGPALTRYELVCRLALAMGVPSRRVEPVRLSDLELTPPRPLNSAMTEDALGPIMERRLIPLSDSIAETAASWRD